MLLLHLSKNGVRMGVLLFRFAIFAYCKSHDVTCTLDLTMYDAKDSFVFPNFHGVHIIIEILGIVFQFHWKIWELLNIIKPMNLPIK
jgi:hypothetical protein